MDMDFTRSRRQSEVVQNMLEALIRYDIIEEDEIAGSAESIVTVECLWNLFSKVEEKLNENTESQNKELLEVQKYVDHVRQLSEEREHLTTEFEKENEKLKGELKNVKAQSVAEASEINDMCRQENLEELVGSSFSEQMAYLLVVRATLLDKLEVMEERYDSASQQCKDMDDQLKALTSEDSELRHRMETAMSEMGGMASKLTDALKERDSLKKEVSELSKALDAIQNLPSLNEAKAEVVTHQKDFENMKNHYTEQNNTLREQLQEVQRQKHFSEEELSTQVEELEEVNFKLREVNQTLNEQLSLSVDAIQEESRKKVQTESQKIIEEMQLALEEDEAKNLAQQEEYEQIINALNKKIDKLEKIKRENLEDPDVSQLSAQLDEALTQLENKNIKLSKVESNLHVCQREMAVREAATESKEQQFEAQVRISSELQDRNIKLEAELAKVVMQLKEAMTSLKIFEKEREKTDLKSFSSNHHVQDGRNERNEEVRHLQEKVEHLESLILRETSGTSNETDFVKLGAKLAVCQAELEEGKKTRAALQDNLEETKHRNDELSRSEKELSRSLTEFQQRALDAESQVLFITGQKDEEESQKLVAELNRSQLEDAVEMLRKRVDFYIIQLQSYVDRYKNLKQKHRTKIRRIRELFLLERKTTADEIEKLEKKLVSAESSLKKELAWKEKAADDVREAERDRRNAISEADRSAQKAEERNEQIKQLNIAADDLVSEKCVLKQQLSLLEQQKQDLENIVKAAQQIERKEELTHLLSSLSLSGSLHLSGNGDYITNTQHIEDSVTKQKINLHEDMTKELKYGTENPSLQQTSYLNLSPSTGRPVPVKRSVY